MARHRYEVSPQVAPDVKLHIDDMRASNSPDDDLIEIGVEAERHDLRFAVTLELSEIIELRDALTAIIDRKFR